MQSRSHKAYMPEPDDPFAYTNLATVYGFQQREDDASRVIAELREKFPIQFQ
jgi:hypothetical protein